MSDVAHPDDGGGGTATMAVSGVVIALAIFSVALRFYTRITTKVGLGWDDWLILAAVISTSLTGILLLWGNAVDPNGHWVSDNTDPNYVYTPDDVFYLKLSFVSSILYFTIAGSTKLSILLMYKRIFSADNTFRRQLAVASALVLGFWVGCTIATLTNCIPLKWSWINGLSDPRYCFNYNIFWMAAGACEVGIDVLILALPIRMVLTLHLSVRKKVTVACVFLLGGFVIITGLVKVVLGYVPGSRVPSYSRTEVWTTVHTGMAIVCASLPIFKPLITRVSNSALVSKLTSFSLSGASRWSMERGSGSGSRRNRRSSASAEESSFGTELRGDDAQQQKAAYTETVERLPLRESLV